MKYYDTEAKVFKEEDALKLTDFEAEVLFQKLKSHYKFGQHLRFRYGIGGRCRTWEIVLCHEPSLLILVHEVAHAIQLKNGKQSNQKWHTKKHMNIMRRVFRYADGKMSKWIADATVQSEKREQTIIRQEHRQKVFEEFKKTPEYRLEQINLSINKWESKKRRAENMLKKLNRRRKIWEKKSCHVG